MKDSFDLNEYRRERNAKLEQENDRLRAECRRLERLLGDALRVAVAGTEVSPLALLAVLGDLNGTNLAMAAFVEQRERRDAEALLERVVRVLKETA